jgi:hypothetical protein
LELLTQHLPPTVRALVYVALFLLVGRVVLSWLPPGRLGGHALRDLPATLAASFVSYWALTHVASGLARLAGLPPTAFRAFLPLVAAAALLRWLTLPAAFVPTPPPRVRPASPLAVALQWLCAAAVAVYLFSPAGQAEAPPVSVAGITTSALTYLTLPALLDHALREFGTRAGPRVLAWLAPALVIWILPDSLIYTAEVVRSPVLFGAGVAFAAVARKRADRRAFAFSAIAFGALATLVAGWPLAVAGLAGLALFGPGASLLERSGWPLAVALAFAPYAWPLLSWRPGGSTYFTVVFVPVVLFTLAALSARGWRGATA